MTPEELNALADRVERYSPAGHYELDKEKERSLNEAIGLLVGVGHRIKVGDPALGNDRWVPMPLKPYVTSIDAAMTLVPDGWWWKVGECSISSDATVGPDFAHCPKDMLVELDDGIDVVIEPPTSTAIALTAACLRAQAYLALRARAALASENSNAE